MSCKNDRTHTDGDRGLCPEHAHQAKTAGAEVSLATQAKDKGKYALCQWKDDPAAPAPEPESTPETDTEEE